MLVSFIIQSGVNKEILGIFIHVPKIAGTSFQNYLRDYGVRLVRPNPAWIGHLTAQQTIDLLESDLSLQQHLGDTVRLFALTREPNFWMQSLYNYALTSSPMVSGLNYEHTFFEASSINQYYLDFIKFNSVKKLSRTSRLWSYNKLSMRPLWKYYAIRYQNKKERRKYVLKTFNLKNIDKAIHEILDGSCDFDISEFEFKTQKIYNTSRKVINAQVTDQSLKRMVQLIHVGDTDIIF
ncbi:hypothetical protein [Synechococcus sp. CS-197]|uniref:hypothetical protein n=1 Tax=Synechococcus sp. CS-197 TaxID=2847985 RepID=UPI00223BCC99|nr:hypothetical protein [Synechococcus sp. CS-197]MCT0250813.1 hypothetical protein [Synechococcus sp. CS-197]